MTHHQIAASYTVTERNKEHVQGHVYSEVDNLKNSLSSVFIIRADTTFDKNYLDC